MITKMSGCVDCDKPCLFTSCPYYSVTVFICDKCRNEVDDLYEVDDYQLCEDCLNKYLKENYLNDFLDEYKDEFYKYCEVKKYE